MAPANGDLACGEKQKATTFGTIKVAKTVASLPFWGSAALRRVKWFAAPLQQTFLR
jgi:hypothetical protein